MIPPPLTECPALSKGTKYAKDMPMGLTFPNATISQAVQEQMQAAQRLCPEQPKHIIR